MAHPPAEELARFVAGALADDARAAIERELARCAECRAFVGALARGAEVSPAVSTPGDAPTVPRALAPLAPGAMLGGRYRVVRLLGEGGMGAVHEVEHELLGRRFALKTLHPALAMQADAVRRFTAEARAAAAIAHPGIVDVVDLGRTDDGAPFLVMELLEGVTLESYAAARPRTPVDDVLAIARGIAGALAAAHAVGIVHRDVKPANVMLEGGATDRVKLLDFGIAKLASPDGTRTRTGMMLGTPRYMAPEQWLAAPDVDARADVFALGVVMFRLATGEMPYQWSDFALGARDPSGARGARPLRELAPEVPPALAELVDRAIAIDRAARPHDAGELRDALDGIASTRARIADAMRTVPSPPHERGAVSSGRQLVGRAHELGELDRLAQQGGVVAVTGPPGIGKSALLDAWLARREVPRIVLEPADAAHPLRALARALAARDPDPVLRDLDAARDRVALAVARALESLEPAMLVLDGAGYLDPVSVRVLGERLARDSRLVVVMALRDGTDGAVLAPLAAAELPLRGLEIADVGELARAAGAHAADPARLHARTGGNPLFVEQLLALDPELRSPETVWPADVHAAVRARIGALPTGEAHAWKVAAVIGAPFHPRDLAALGVAGGDAAVEALVRREVLAPREAGLVSFVADVLRDVAYEAVPAPARAALHREIADVLAQGPRPEWPDVARHFERAGDSEGAARAYASAALHAPPSLAAERRARFAERAIELGGTRLDLEIVRIDSLELAGAFDASLEAIDALLARATDPDARAQARLRRGVILQRTGRGAEALDELAAAVREGQGGGAPATLARALGKHAVALAYANRIDEARTQLSTAERTMLLRAPELRAEAAVWRAQIAGVSGDLGDRRNSYWAAVELYRESGDLRLAAGAAMNLADTYNQLGAYDEAERALERARAECLALGVRVMAGYAALNLGFARIERGALEGARAALEEAATIAAETGEARLARFAALYRARLEARRGAPDAARERLLALISDASQAGDQALGALAESALARVLLVQGETDAALARSERAVALLEALGGLEEGEAEVRWTHARCLAAAGRHDDAAHALARGATFVRELARRIGDPEWRARLLEDVEANRALVCGNLALET